MSLKPKKKDRILNFVYSFGASIVILGALFKINHYEIGPITGSMVLAIGLGVEAIIFAIFAFDPPAADYEWERVYPELTDENAVPAVRKKSQALEVKEAEISLSKKLDEMLKEAKLDASLIASLRTGIENFGKAVEDINKTADAAVATQKYGDQLALAANHMESLNALYQIQLEHGKQQVELNAKFINDLNKSAEESKKFTEEMNNLTSNLNNLNKVYGGMLNAMRA